MELHDLTAMHVDLILGRLLSAEWGTFFAAANPIRNTPYMFRSSRSPRSLQAAVPRFIRRGCRAWCTASTKPTQRRIGYVRSLSPTGC